MKFIEEDKILIRSLHELRGHTACQLMREFSECNLSVQYEVNHLSSAISSWWWTVVNWVSFYRVKNHCI